MADEMIAAQVIDPSLFTKSEQMYVDICTTPGARYGDAMFWPKNWDRAPAAGKAVSAADRRVFVDPRQYYMGPPPSAGVVNVLQEIDHDRFKKLFVDLMTKPVRRA
jgi:inosine-uridine nucleoside N-ribohydrolase